MIFFEVVLPVILIFAAGFIFQKKTNVDILSVSTFNIYVLLPCLVFRTFYTSDLTIQYLYMVIFSALLLIAIIIINKVYTKLRNHSVSTESALILSTAFMNAGNYGAPIILFAYGEEGFAYVITFMVLQAIIMNFFGVYYAAKGAVGIGVAIQSVLKMPATYAVGLALLFKFLPIGIPINIYQTIDLVAEATIPTAMLILGMQLSKIEWAKMEWEKVNFAILTRLFVSPLIAFLLVALFPIDPLLAKVLIVSAAMPTAATTVMYAIQFNSEPKFVSSIAFITTSISFFTITVILSLLNQFGL
jgi:malate permease and related proteins